jgi:hypothetical protein
LGGGAGVDTVGVLVSSWAGSLHDSHPVNASVMQQVLTHTAQVACFINLPLEKSWRAYHNPGAAFRMCRTDTQ